MSTQQGKSIVGVLILSFHSSTSFVHNSIVMWVESEENCEDFSNGLSCPILGDPGAISRVDKMSMVKVYCKIETSPWALTFTEPFPEAFELPANQRRGAAG